MIYNKAGNRVHLREINGLVNSSDLENDLGDIPLLFLSSDHSEIEEKNKKA
jgi:hypothetical protein